MLTAAGGQGFRACWGDHHHHHGLRPTVASATVAASRVRLAIAGLGFPSDRRAGAHLYARAGPCAVRGVHLADGLRGSAGLRRPRTAPVSRVVQFRPSCKETVMSPYTWVPTRSRGVTASACAAERPLPMGGRRGRYDVDGQPGEGAGALSRQGQPAGPSAVGSALERVSGRGPEDWSRRTSAHPSPRRSLSIR